MPIGGNVGGNGLISTLQVIGSTKLGSSSPAIKMAYYTGTCMAVNTDLNIAHELVQANVIGVQCLVLDVNNCLDPPARGSSAEYYECYITSTYIRVYTGPNATNIAGRPVYILITYRA